MSIKKSLKDRLLDRLKETLPKEKIKILEGVAKSRKHKLIDSLIEKGVASEEEILSVLSRELKVPLLNLSKFKISPEVTSLIPEKLAKQYCIMPISLIGNSLTVAINDPLNILAYDDLRSLTSYEINTALALSKDIREAIERNYHAESLKLDGMLDASEKTDDKLKIALEEAERIDIGETLTESKKPPIVKIVDLILSEALKKRASDIHIEPLEFDVRVRFRIDGDLQEILSLPKKNQNAILARVKIISGLDITEFRIPQDGRFKAKILGKEIDYRVSILPTSFGGKVVMRALDKSNLSVGLESLGFSKHVLGMFNQAISSPYGMILVTGPTGSGKSTTLYSVLNKLNNAEKNIITVEDPVEYQVEGITQVQANSEIGLSFASGLRSILRQSPDIIMIGEIRDHETADIAVKASLTGQLVLSTLHTNDACGAITRLIDMGVEPFLVSASLLMACAQRLVRKVCPSCKDEVDIPEVSLEKLGIKLPKGTKLFRGKGCNRCVNTGYYGRIAILEIVLIDDVVREMIMKNVSSDQIKDYVLKEKGFKTLRDDALEKLFNGLTTLEEVLRVTSEN